MTEEERIRALAAKALLDEAVFQKAVAAIETKVFEALKATPANGADLRERIWAEYRGMSAIVAQLQQWSGDYDFAVKLQERRR